MRRLGRGLQYWNDAWRRLPPYRSGSSTVIEPIAGSAVANFANAGTTTLRGIGGLEGSVAASINFTEAATIRGTGRLTGSMTAVFDGSGLDILRATARLTGGATLTITIAGNAVLLNQGYMTSSEPLLTVDSNATIKGRTALTGSMTAVFDGSGFDAIRAVGRLTGSELLTFAGPGTVKGLGQLRANVSSLWTFAGGGTVRNNNEPVLRGIGRRLLPGFHYEGNAVAPIAHLRAGVIGSLQGSAAIVFAGPGVLIKKDLIRGSVLVEFGSNTVLTSPATVEPIEGSGLIEIESLANLGTRGNIQGSGTVDFASVTELFAVGRIVASEDIEFGSIAVAFTIDRMTGSASIDFESLVEINDFTLSLIEGSTEILFGSDVKIKGKNKKWQKDPRTPGSWSKTSPLERTWTPESGAEDDDWQEAS